MKEQNLQKQASRQSIIDTSIQKEVPKIKILLTGGNGMLAYDFIRTQSEKFDIVAVDR